MAWDLVWAQHCSPARRVILVNSLKGDDTRNVVRGPRRLVAELGQHDVQLGEPASLNFTSICFGLLVRTLTQPKLLDYMGG